MTVRKTKLFEHKLLAFPCVAIYKFTVVPHPLIFIRDQNKYILWICAITTQFRMF